MYAGWRSQAPVTAVVACTSHSTHAGRCAKQFLGCSFEQLMGRVDLCSTALGTICLAYNSKLPCRLTLRRYGSLGESALGRHLDPFSRFRLPIHGRDRQTDRPRYVATFSAVACS